MINPPKIRERMVRLKTKDFTIRFWFDEKPDLKVDYGPIGAALINIREDLDFSPLENTRDVADFIAHSLPDGTPLAAMEVLLNADHSGTVDYFEWP